MIVKLVSRMKRRAGSTDVGFTKKQWQLIHMSADGLPVAEIEKHLELAQGVSYKYKAEIMRKVVDPPFNSWFIIAERLSECLKS